MEVREFRLPDLGEGLEDAEVVAWRVAEGDRVELNQTLVEVNTAKALVELPAPWPGVVERRHAAEGGVVRVGDPLVSIRVEGPKGALDETGEPGQEPPEAAVGSRGSARRPVLVGYGVEDEGEERAPDLVARRRAGDRDPASTPAGPVLATPPVRKLAKELGVDLRALPGTGPGGRVTRSDVERAAGAPSPEAEGGPGERIPVRGTRRLIAEKMARSAREIPHVTTFLTVDATWVEALRRELSEETGERVTALPVVVRALAEVSASHPKLTSSFDAEHAEIVLHGECHVGIATDTAQGLLVPVVRDVPRLGITELAGEIGRLVASARSGTIRPADLVGSTVTVTNVGAFGSEFGTPVINHPEAAILSVGVVAPRALVIDGRVEARPAATLGLTFDHRVMDGAEAGRALRDLARLLESPFRLGAIPR